MQQTAFRDKNSRRGNFPRRLTSRTPTFDTIEQRNLFVEIKVERQAKT